jgi:predicted outer membrane repeat protein
VSLSNSSVVNSSAIASSSYGLGGAIYSRGFVDLTDSFVSGNTASRSGGGVYAYAGLSVKYSTIDDNRAYQYGGGVFATGNIVIANSTISNNQAIGGYGGAILDGYRATVPITVLSSTISGNSAGFLAGAEILEYDGRVMNSTIAFNHEGTASKYGAGLYIRDAVVDIESTIIANNTYAGTQPDDVGGTTTGTVTGANNLIGYSTIPVPNDTILLQSPMLGVLAYNGGTTRTHMILSGSPAIDAGSNVTNASYDQRGGGYPRVIGPAADIGAYELDTNDVIFANGLDP